ncbi:hypothetical protein [Aquirufa salirivi]|uniref:hypothetical protein n=1 Tax=Aquirufa salirivi TaxID=3104729 RepID=UPI0038782CC9
MEVADVKSAHSNYLIKYHPKKSIVSNAMSNFGLQAIETEENILPSGKVFLTFAFQRNEAL